MGDGQGQTGAFAPAEQPNRRARQLLAATSDAVCVLDPRGRVRFMNDAAARMSGWTSERANGQPYAAVLERSRLDESPLPAGECPIHNALADGSTHALDHCLLWSRTGTSTAVSCRCTPLTDGHGRLEGVVVTLTDIGERLTAQRYRSLVGADADFSWRTAPDGRLVDIGRGWFELTGQPTDEALGRGWLGPVHPADRVACRDAWRQAVETITPFSRHCRIRAHDGGVRWCHLHASPVRDATGRVVEWFGTGQDITDSKLTAERERREREEYRTLVECTSAIVWRGDPRDFRFTYVSPEAETLLGYAPERWTDEPGFWVDHIHPDDRDWAPAYCARATAEQRQHSFDYRMIAADGRVVWLRDVVSVLVEDGEPVTLVGVMIDITGTKEAEQATAYVSGLQRILVEQSREMVAAGGALEATLSRTLARIGEYCGVDRSYLMRFEDEGRAMTLTHEWCSPRTAPLQGQLVGRPASAVPMLMQRMRARSPVHVPSIAALDAEWQTDVEAFASQGDLRSFVLVPMVVDDALHGYIGFDTLGEERSWSDDEIRLLQGLADVIAATIQRWRAEQARRDSDARFRTIAEHLPGAVFERIREADGTVRLTYLGGGIASVFGIDRRRALADPRTIMQAVHPEDRAAYRAALRRSARTLEPLDLGHRIVKPGGEIRRARLLGKPRGREDGAIIWDGITIDETERLEAEEQLRESRSLLEIAGRTARVGGWTVHLDSGRLALSDEGCALHGLPPGSTLTVEEALAFYVAEDRDRVRELFEACMRTGNTYDEEFRFVPRGRDPIWVRVIGESVRDERGHIVQVRGALQDITAEKEARHESQRLAERLTNTLESITDAFFTIDPDWRITYVNREAERLMNRRREDVLGLDLWDEYPDLRGTIVEHEFRRAMDENRAVEFEFHYEALGRWFEIRAYPSREGIAVYFRDVTERKRQQEEIEFLALYDPLTQLPNRRLLLDRLRSALRSSERDGQRSAVLFLDLDHFKTLNDTLGHDAGDRMLQETANRLAGCVRASDTVARFGGDEFAVILHDLGADTDTALARTERMGEKIRAALTDPYQLGEHERYTTVSIGITLFGDAGEDSADDVMKRADLAMYQAKDAGRSTLRVFAPSMRAAVQSRVNLEADLRQALDDDAIEPHLQPQFDEHGRMIGVEALARWTHRERGTIPPADFIPVAEETGLILPLGTTVLERGCRCLAAWSARPDLAGLRLSVNVSARQFHHPDFVEHVQAVLERTGAPPTRLGLELTESLLLSGMEDTIRKISALREHGVRFTLDDFGTGYSSLSYLKRLPIDELKIDQAFVRDALADASDAAIVRTIIVLADAMGLEVIAEGVESEALRDMLSHYGCRRFQGYLFGRPMPIEEFETRSIGS